MIPPRPRSTLFPYTTLFRSEDLARAEERRADGQDAAAGAPVQDAFARQRQDRKSTRLNSSHLGISYAVFCLKKKNIVYNEECQSGCADQRCNDAFGSALITD